ncbi:GTP cyclohydrolase II [Halobacteriovorax marinus SJ]|uniref:GTP cyclohydrolase II n=1 Tax=Halobacteriovorax marinus (strain ATCC BAA-682 / DSM 15412 / SJ) TaxID=862908 RepID=E1X532_HALMS|nr:GTP cyclohydrolase II [Halobacteriovorax marinus]CBW25503.1 GTP cyclohydrolase II [Halobacteriovorax marinus SJ]
MSNEKFERPSHVVLTSHSNQVFKESLPVNWGATNPKDRGPIIATISEKENRNAIGTHSGSYTVYRALSIAKGDYAREHRPELENTFSPVVIKPQESWFDPEKIVSIDPWGGHIQELYGDYIKEGYNIKPTIAVTQARLHIPEIFEAIDKGRLEIDGDIVAEDKSIKVTKIAFEPVWYLPGIAKRLGIEEGELRKILFNETGGMFPELVTRPDLKVLLPPIGSTTAYVFGDVEKLSDSEAELSCRVHDECNGSDVFGSDICTCRPYLTYGIEHAAKTAQKGGVGLIVYYRKEGRALGEVTKFLVYNARKRQEGGDTASNYFKRTECVAGVEDARFQEFMPDILQYFGIKKIHNLHSMSNMKYDAIAKSGIEVVNRISIPDELIPADAQVEMEAKKAAGYFTAGEVKDKDGLDKVLGRNLEE